MRIMGEREGKREYMMGGLDIITDGKSNFAYYFEQYFSWNFILISIILNKSKKNTLALLYYNDA